MIKTFEKWHGCKNDFVIMWLSDHEGEIVLNSIKRMAHKICSKSGDGVGADGILVLHNKNSTDPLPYLMTIINSDGSIAANCGNGLRVAALSVRRKHQSLGQEVPAMLELNVLDRSFICAFYKGSNPYVSVEMGSIIFGDSVSWFKNEKSSVIAKISKMGLGVCDIDAADVGNKHLVIRNIPSTAENLKVIAPQLQESTHWDGINVHLDQEKTITKDDQHLALKHIGTDIQELHEVHCYERGVGVTPACGSGACSVASAAWAQGFLGSGKWIAIDMPGGRLYCKNEEGRYTLAGPGQHVFDGTLEV